MDVLYRRCPLSKEAVWSQQAVAGGGIHQASGTGLRDSRRRRSKKKSTQKPSVAREFGFLRSRAIEALGPAFLPVKNAA